MLDRIATHEIRLRLSQFPAVAIIGPRQVGKTTLALQLAQGLPTTYLDLERPSDRAKLADPELFLEGQPAGLTILDEVHRAPELFQVLRGIIDARRRTGRTAGQFLLLGSASIDLLRQSGESLAGRIAYVELAPFNILEVGRSDQEKLWTRGGFPGSFLATDDEQSTAWRQNFVRTYLDRDIPQLGPRVSAQTMERFWTMLCHCHGGLRNAADLASSLGVDSKTIARYLDLFVDLLLVRRLEPFHTNTGKRLVKAPKIYVRDSGILHTLLNLHSREQIFGHPILGRSWEGWVIEQLIAAAPAHTRASFYRTAAGAELDLLLEMPGGQLWAFEIKHGLSPKMERGFHQAREDLKPSRSYVVYPGSERYRTSADVEVIGVPEMAGILLDQHRP
ncbi:MAG: ATP-binding protein, partial [Planctomycetota bacterium]|nr:ATP-binding protein [Planctomycetota bacterium]